MPHMPPAHHETSKRDSSMKQNKRKTKQNKTIPNLNSYLTKSMTHHNQTKELTTWFHTFKSCTSLRHKFAYDVKQEDFEPRAWGSTFMKLKSNFLLFLSKPSTGTYHPL
jgi:hypothetical protein